MSRRPSATSIPPLSTPAIHTHAISPSRNIPNVFSKPSNIYPNGHSGLDPDELFTKHTVLEVKAVQQKLRADADAKQEELRLMNRERYRDLLQASTSIISLAHSSQWVSETLDKVHELVLSQKEPPIQERTSSALDGKYKNLHSLQSLAAHMKLLLDTPEHLWRFIERKKYLQAAWLFLLARVVYRALVQTDNQDEESWTEQGIEVSSEFPLVDRQWDIVSQFRSQIIHKATLSLREIDISPEDICSTLVTLHLLDSRPLIETFSTLLAQRSKALQITLHRAPDQDNANLHNHQLMAVRNVKGAIEKAVIVISKTVGTSRSLFVDDSSTPSMIKQVLKFINSDLAPSVESDSLPPSQLRLTTQSLLASLMPSTQLSLLPSSLNTYKPYVDLESSSSLFSTSVLSQKLEVWLRDSVETFQGCAREWLHHARTVKAVWNIRTSTWQLSQRSEMSGEEKLQLLSVLDNLCQERIIGIWESLLLESSQNFSERLSQSLSSFEVGINQETGASAEGLFITSSLPASPFVSSNAASEDAAFQKYASALKKQLIGRTPLIDGILSGLNNAQGRYTKIYSIYRKQTIKALCYRNPEKDHQPSADIVSTKVLESTDALADGIKDDQSSAIDKLGFLAHTTVELCILHRLCPGLDAAMWAFANLSTRNVNI
ncbi:hypothetical protein BDQ17DRAFT_1418679 [Cyathus striatus]|nr:hypothetical protein BDQ17DRAFT_1418679 [Cyathus striatus]